MKLGIVADEISRDFRQAVRIGSEVGLQNYEIRFLQTGRFPLCTNEELREIERVCAGENVEVTAVSPGLFKWTNTDDETFRHELNEILPRTIELTQRWNVKNLIVFGFHKPQMTEESFEPGAALPEILFDRFAEVAQIAEAENLTVLIEPEPICWIDTHARAAEAIRRIGSPVLKINYDPGNVAWLTKSDPLAELEPVARFVGGVHVKDLRELRDKKPIWTTPGNGMIDYTAHFAKLRTAGYYGTISLEPHFPLDADNLWACKNAVEKFWTAAAELQVAAA